MVPGPQVNGSAECSIHILCILVVVAARVTSEAIQVHGLFACHIRSPDSLLQASQSQHKNSELPTQDQGWNLCGSIDPPEARRLVSPDVDVVLSAAASPELEHPEAGTHSAEKSCVVMSVCRPEMLIPGSVGLAS